MEFIRLRILLRFTMNSTRNGRLDYFFLFIQIGVFKMNALKLEVEKEGVVSNIPFINFLKTRLVMLV